MQFLLLNCDMRLYMEFNMSEAYIRSNYEKLYSYLIVFNNTGLIFMEVY